MRIAFNTPAEAAREITYVWRAKGATAHARPYNRYQADEGLIWWSIPSSEWPAYHLSKFIAFSKEPFVNPGQLFIGLNVEHGLGSGGIENGAFPNEWLMNKTWSWHRFIADLEGGVFGNALKKSIRGIGNALRIIVAAHVPVLKAKIQPPSDLIEFESKDGSNIFLLRKDIKTHQKFLLKSSGCCNLTELGSELESVPDKGWVWIDVFVGYVFKCSGPRDSNSLSAAHLWDKLLAPLSFWMA